MDRINLIRKDEKTLPVTINGQDIDLTFDAGTQTKTILIGMMDSIMSYQEKAKETSKVFNETDKDPDNAKTIISGVKEFAEQGRLLCRELSSQMAEICPKWQETVGNNFIDLTVFMELVGAMMTIINEKEVTEKVSEEISTER